LPVPGRVEHEGAEPAVERTRHYRTDIDAEHEIVGRRVPVNASSIEVAHTSALQNRGVFRLRWMTKGTR